MSKLFEVSVCGTKHVMNADRIAYAMDWSSFVRVYFSDRLFVDVDAPYEQFIQLWRKALGEDTRTAEQKQADARRMIDAIYGWSPKSGVVGHVPSCACATCLQLRDSRV